MNDLNRALGDIRNIRRQMAQTTEFYGYSPVTLAATGVLALIAASAQALWLPDPAKHILIYVGIWVSTAVTSAALIAVQTVTRAHRIHSGLADEMIHMAVEQFLPIGRCGRSSYAVIIAFRPFGSVDASGTLANHFQPRSLCFVPFLVTPNGRIRHLVSFHRTCVYCIGA